MFPDKDLSLNLTEELPEENTKECALIEVTQIAGETLNKFALEPGAQDLRFEEVKIFREAENHLIIRGDSLKIKVCFGAYSGNSEKAMDFFAGGEKIEIRNGVRILKRKVET